nr:ralA binding protein 1 [Hymenolepis microstoma]
MDKYKKSNETRISESPKSEHFWLASGSSAIDATLLSIEGIVNAHSDDELTDMPLVFDPSSLRDGTPEENNLLMEDDAPLCSAIEEPEPSHSSSKKPMASVFRLPTSKKNRGRKEPLRLSTPTTADQLPHTFSPPEETSLFSALQVDKSSKAQISNQAESKAKKLKQSKSSVKSQTGDEKNKSKAMKKIEEAAGVLEFPLKVSNKKKKLKKKHKKKCGEPMPTEPIVDRTLIGVSLETALERNPSHDGVPLPAFFRYLIDFVEKYGLAIEGIYRVPGVNSQVKHFINALNNGIEFPDIPPTSPGFSDLEATPKSARCMLSDKLMIDSQQGGMSPPHVFFTPPPPPHDPAVVTSVLKQFLRSLPESLLTVDLGPSIESACDQLSSDSNTTCASRRRRLAELIHRELPRPNKFLLAWLLQHMTRVINRAGDNKMTLANLVIVFSPTLRMSHRLLALLLSQPPPGEEFKIEISEEEATRVVGCPHKWSPISSPHWLFPHPVYTYRPYKPPLPPPPPSAEAAGMPLDLPDSLSDLEDELFKQESLLAFTHQQIASGRASAEKDAYIWEVQHLVSKIKHKKMLLALTDPDAIRAELKRHEARLERVQQELVKCKGTEGSEGITVASTEDVSPLEKVSRPVSSRLPVSQFDLVSPRLEKRQKKRLASTVTKKSFVAEHRLPSLDAEFWELQQNVTMLKRRLKLCQVSSQTQSQLPQQSNLPRELVPTESLDTEEVFNFSLRKPAAFPPAPKAASVMNPLSPKAEQKEEEVPTPKVESFPVEWPATPTGCAESSVTSKSAEIPELVSTPPKERVDEVATPVSEQPPTQIREEPVPLDPASQYLLSIYNYWAVRQQELLACQHDLKSRIRSQEAEIARIKMCIEQMIITGKVREQQVRQYLHENEFLLRTPTVPSTGVQQSPSLSAFADISTEDDSEDDDDDDDDEVEMASTLLQLMRDDARLEALNAAHIENIIAERDSCAHLKAQLRLSTCLPPPPIPSIQMNAFR